VPFFAFLSYFHVIFYDDTSGSGRALVGSRIGSDASEMRVVCCTGTYQLSDLEELVALDMPWASCVGCACIALSCPRLRRVRVGSKTGVDDAACGALAAMPLLSLALVGCSSLPDAALTRFMMTTTLEVCLRR
jgi:hypothetical protein